MVLQIPVGSVLRQRYVIQQVLGQGGFGRTYLALDHERFDEPCVIKEFLVPYQDKTLVEKSKTLFQREASILYQIQHPQIPRFWAAFEDEQRLFLVQDYVQGETYRRLLSDRKQQQQTFTETEGLHFLQHMLPVLTYIHDRDIVHRDISPENIILRTQTTTELSTTGSMAGMGLPVLIDFGAVKEATSHWPLMSAATRVGKVGYAPPEQLQTGKVYPNSDLYALAATCLALLTGREPQSLLDSQTLTWRWQPYATLQEDLGRILQRMLSVYPGDRYLSAREVLTDLEPLLQSSTASTLLPSSAAAPSPRPDEPAGSRPGQEPSQAVVSYVSPGRQAKPSARPVKPAPHDARSPKRQAGLKGLKIGAAAACLIALGVAVPVVWRNSTQNPDSDVWFQGKKLPESEASQILESQGLNSSQSALKSPTDKAAPTGDRPLKSDRPLQAIQFPPGKSATILQGTLADNEQQTYVLKGAEGQIVTASLTGEGVTMNLLRSNQESIDSASDRVRAWTGSLPADDQYLIQVLGSGSYSLDIAATPFSRPSQEQTQRVAFARGTSGTTVTGKIVPRQVRRYLLKAEQGQILVLKILYGKISMSAIAPDGQRLGGSTATSKIWQGRLPMTGDFVLEISTTQPSNFALSLEVF